MYTLAKMFEEATIQPIPPEFYNIPIVHPVWGSPVTPRKHQIEGLNLCFQGTRTGLYDEQGTGKTLIAQAFLAWQAVVGNRAVCLMPPVLLSQFRDSFLKGFTDIEKLISCEIYRGTPKKRQALVNAWEGNWPDLVLMTYDMFREEWPIFSHYQALVADEARVLGNHENRTYREMQAFMGKPGEKYALVMNGTPDNTDLSSLFGYIDFISPGIYVSRLHFDTLHVNFKRMPVRLAGGKIREVRTIAGFKNVEPLWRNFYQSSRRVLKSQVLELAAKNIIPWSFELSAKHYEKYREFVEGKLLVFDDDTILDGTTSSALRTHAMQSVVHAEILGVKEISEVVNQVQVICDMTDLSSTKVFVLAHYQKTVELLSQTFQAYNPAILYGPTAHRNEEEKDKFLHDPTCRMLIANYLSGGVGLNLQDVCYTAIAVEPVGSPGTFEQACDRLHRSGQKSQVNVYVLMPKGTAFIDTVKLMTKRKLVNEQVVSRAQLMDSLLGRSTDLDEVRKEATPRLQPDEDVEGVASGWETV